MAETWEESVWALLPFCASSSKKGRRVEVCGRGNLD